MRLQPPAILLILSTLPLASCSRVIAHANTTPSEGIPVRVAQVVFEDVPLEIAAVGNVEAIESVEVKPRISGQIRRVAFTEGQEVTKGQLLFTVDRETLDRQQAQQQAELERDVSMEQQANAVEARDAASEKQRHAEAETATKLGELGVLSGQSVNQAVSTSESAHASVHADQAAMAAAASAVQADRARLGQTQLQRSFAEVVAPISGRAGATIVKAGNVVRENDTTLVTLLQTAPIHITFGVPEQSLVEVQRLSKQASLEVEADTGNGAMAKGHLDFIDNTVDATTGTIRLKASFTNMDRSLWPGEFVHVRLRLRLESGKTVVPESAIQQGIDGRYAWKVESTGATMIPVAVERSYQQQAKDGSTLTLAVLAGGGLHPGDTVVTEGQLRLTPGARITAMEGQR